MGKCTSRHLFRYGGLKLIGTPFPHRWLAFRPTGFVWTAQARS